MKKCSVFMGLVLAGCGAYYHGTVIPYEKYNEVQITSEDKEMARRWAMEDVQLYCNGGKKLEEGQVNRKYMVVEQLTTDYSGVIDEGTDRAISNVAGAASGGLLIASAIKRDTGLAVAGLGAGAAAGAMTGRYTTTVKFICK